MESSRISGNFRMLNGELFNFSAPELAEYDIELVATVLGKKCRFNDHISRHYSVAEHSYHASYIYLLNRKGALMHDAPEFVMGDLITPLKRDATSFKATEKHIMRDMETRFDFVEPDPLTFKIVDTLLFHQEEQVLYPEIDPIYDVTIPFQFWDPATATQKFLERFYELSGATMATTVTPPIRHQDGHSPICQ